MWCVRRANPGGIIRSVWEELSEPWRACVEEVWEAYRSGSLPIGALATVPDENGHDRLLCFPEDIPIIEKGIRRLGEGSGGAVEEESPDRWLEHTGSSIDITYWLALASIG